MAAIRNYRFLRIGSLTDTLMNVFGPYGNYSPQTDLKYFKPPYIGAAIGGPSLNWNGFIFEWDTRTLVVCGGTQVRLNFSLQL